MTVKTFGGTTYSNGNAPAALLAELNPKGLHGTVGRSRAFLRKDAAASWNRAIAEVKAKTGLDLTVRGWNRSYAEQRAFFLYRYSAGAYSRYGDYRYWNGVRYGRVRGAAAAVPGYSNHGWGLAVDVLNFGGVGQFENARRTKAMPILRKHGWTDTEGHRVNEPWHLVYDPAADKGKVAAPKKRKPRRLPTVRRGSRGADVKLWQQVLGVKADGVFGQGTEAATERWQKARGLKADGVVGPASWYRATQGVKYGDKGPAVKVAQRVMGYTGAKVQGSFGPGTRGRAKEVQRWLGVTADGAWGPKTIDRLIEKG